MVLVGIASGKANPLCNFDTCDLKLKGYPLVDDTDTDLQYIRNKM